MDKDHEQQRRQLWCDVYVAYVSSGNSSDSDGGRRWADKALERFDERFTKKQDEPESPT